MKIGLKCEKGSEQLRTQLKTYLEDAGHEVIDFYQLEKTKINQMEDLIEKEYEIKHDSTLLSSSNALIIGKTSGVSGYAYHVPNKTTVKGWVQKSFLMSLATEHLIMPLIKKVITPQRVFQIYRQLKQKKKHHKHSD